ncbi:uncharacterized protein TNCV_3451281 [Trichonephila clavipes]|uniref:Uncharacterized protein n=1 Tax=Trichonephila clavipes TaxID=2585209 RepID=A0A8X7BMD3_TRICX|nr:uncharacterized protein TNCV_3451281 [Trichonephila clavipes]
MSLVVNSIFIILSTLIIESHSLHTNSSHAIPDIISKGTTATLKTSNIAPASTSRQSSNTLGIGGPVAAGLAFVGLNLAFISLLVPFVITAVAVGDRRSYKDENALSGDLDKLRSLYGWGLNDFDISERSSSNENKDVMDKIARFGQKLLTEIKAVSRNT